MVLIKFLSREKDIVRYSYQPEKKGEVGILAYNFTNDENIIEKLASEDSESTSFYRRHVIGLIRKSGIQNLPQEELICWY